MAAENDIHFFETPSEFRAWLKKNHSDAAELLVGYHKVHTHRTGRKSMTWSVSVAEALCFGWIDGIRKRLDNDRYTIRFTPRRKNSQWSAVNIRMVAVLEAEGRMTDAGRAAFEARPHKTGPRSQGYSYEKREAEFDAIRRRTFRKNKKAWTFFEAQPPGYRKRITWWVMSAKQAGTRDSRLKRLIESSAQGKRIQ